jgi:molybdopterin synthase sulfur carrier subunit
MKVVFYGRLADAVGSEIDLEIPVGCSIAEMRKLLAAEHPDAAASLAGGRALACVGGSYVSDDYVTSAGDQVEFLPPVSGG